MQKEYDLKKLKLKSRGPLVDGKSTKVTKTVKIDLDIIGWLLQESERRRVPYQTMINSILKEAMDRSSSLSPTNYEQIMNDIAELKKKVG